MGKHKPDHNKRTKVNKRTRYARLKARTKMYKGLTKPTSWGKRAR